MPPLPLTLPPGAGPLLHWRERAALRSGQRLSTPVRGGGPLVWHHWPCAGPQPAQPPVVLLHGGSGSWTHWLRNIAALRRAGRPVWAPDLPGCGESAPPPAEVQDAAAMRAPLLQGLRRLNLGAFDLVGFSFGAVVASLLAAARPDHVRRLVLVGAPAMGLPASARLPLKAWRHLPTEGQRQQAHRHNLRALMLHDDSHLSPLALRLHAHNVQRDRLPRRRPAQGDELRQILSALPASIPVHAIYGEHDALYPGQMPTLAAAFASASAHFGGFERIAHAGHWVQFAAPRAFNAALSRALSPATPAG